MLFSGFEVMLETDLYSISLNYLVMHREKEIGSYALRREKYMHSLSGFSLDLRRSYEFETFGAI